MVHGRETIQQGRRKMSFQEGECGTQKQRQKRRSGMNTGERKGMAGKHTQGRPMQNKERAVKRKILEWIGWQK